MSTTEIITVTVCSGNEYRARAGTGAKACRASCNNDPEIAAMLAAGKYFGLHYSYVAVLQIQHGTLDSRTPHRYLAGLAKAGIREEMEAVRDAATSKQAKLLPAAKPVKRQSARRAKR